MCFPEAKQVIARQLLRVAAIPRMPGWPPSANPGHSSIYTVCPVQTWPWFPPK
jgi:hypothetical protein